MSEPSLEDVAYFPQMSDRGKREAPVLRPPRSGFPSWWPLIRPHLPQPPKTHPNNVDVDSDVSPSSTRNLLRWSSRDTAVGSGGVCTRHHDGHHGLEGAAALGEEILHQSAPLWVSYLDTSPRFLSLKYSLIRLTHPECTKSGLKDPIS